MELENTVGEEIETRRKPGPEVQCYTHPEWEHGPTIHGFGTWLFGF